MNVLACQLVPDVTLLTVLALPDPKPHVLPLPLLQTVVRPVAPVLCSSVRPLHSVQLVMVHPAAPREFARTYFGPHRRRRGSPHHITRCRKSSALCDGLFCLNMTTVPGSREVLQEHVQLVEVVAQRRRHPLLLPSPPNVSDLNNCTHFLG